MARSTHSAAKAGIIGATKALALELAKRQITVNCVAPGLIETEMIGATPLEEIIKLIPAQRIGQAGGGCRRRDFSPERRCRLHHSPGDCREWRAGMSRRIAVTGMAGISPLGNDWPGVRARLGEYRNAVARMPEWAGYDGLNTLLGAPAAEFTLSERYTTKATRSMGRVALMATRASELALADAGLLGDPLVKSGKLGIAYGSSAGTPKAICDFGKMIDEKSTKGINATTYIKMMSHTAPVNLGVFLGVTGRIITTSSACTSGSQGSATPTKRFGAGSSGR